MWRFLFNRLNNEKFIQYLSETYVVRRVAQMTVSMMYRVTGGKPLSAEQVTKALESTRAKRVFESFKQNLKKELEDAQRGNKKGPK